ncbi:CHAT domain-containing protein [Anabaena sp. PCC 7938]|uniref:CHAT domain-containing protein n=1 Tax=Anabaena sp. PCC 7938 TaxID=1296340 RepID=UPI003BEEB68A
MQAGCDAGSFREYQKAVASFDKALEIKPNDYDAWCNRGVVLCDHFRQYEQAVASYDKALQIKPDKYEAWNNRGVALGNLGEYEQAVASYDKALKIKPDDYQACFNRGVTLGYLGEYEQAVASYDKVLEFKPDYYDAWYNRGILLCDNLGRYEQAVASFNKALEIKPDYYDAWCNRGVALDHLGEYEQAVASYDKALEIKPDDHETWCKRGVTLDHLGEYEQAVASYDKALKFKPDYHKAWYGRGVTLDHLGENEQAVASYNKALEFKPDYHEVWNSRGNALNNLGEYEQAVASYDKALEIKPDYYDAWCNRGVALDHLGEYEQAVTSYDKALEFKPDKYEAWCNRGVVLCDLGEYEQAVASYDKALEIKPDLHEVWINRGIASGNSVSCDPFLSLSSTIARNNPDLDKRGYHGVLASYEEGFKYCHQDTHPEGWGLLHQAIGIANYVQGQKDFRPRTYWFKAVKSYNQALKTLTASDFPEFHLKVLHDLINVRLHVGEIAKIEELQRQGTDVLRCLLNECQSPGKKKQLALKFAGFQQFTVDLAVQSGNWCAALELAEAGKNACLSWLLDGWSDESPKLAEIQQLLNTKTAIVYWHLSPYALHTFILTHNNQPIILTSSQSPAQRLQDFEKWAKTWNEEYSNYRKGKDNEGEKITTWRDNLPSMLQQLGEILDIGYIVNVINDLTPQPPSLQGNGENIEGDFISFKDDSCSPLLAVEGLGERSIQNLILIPHRDLHCFPIHALFPNNFTIIYLPSAKTGISLKTLKSTNLEKIREINVGAIHKLPLLSVEHPDSKDFGILSHAEIEVAAIAKIFQVPTERRIGEAEATKQAIQTALINNSGIFHFTGHSFYNFHHPKQSALALSGEDLLTLEEICNIENFGYYQLVTLSSCETAIASNQTITAEYVGLVSGFLFQGVANVVSTLWTVTDDSSSFLMIYFYWQLKKGKSPTIALKKAQNWLRNLTFLRLEKIYRVILSNLPENDQTIRPFIRRKLYQISIMEDIEKQKKPYIHPYYWAGFIITGF